MAVFTDDFNRANENPLANGNWTTVSTMSPYEIVSNSATPQSVGADCGSYYSAATIGADQYAQAALTTTNTSGGEVGMGVMVRCAGAAKTFYWLVVDHASSNNCQIAKFTSGTHATIGAAFTQAWTDGDVWRLEVSGTTLTAKLNGSTVTTRTDSSIASGQPGLAYSSAVTGAVPTADNFEGGDLTVAPSVSVQTAGIVQSVLGWAA